VLDVKDRRKITPASDNITVVLCEEFYKTSQELRDSAEGVGNGKKCHLCCLFLRSLQSHNSEDSTPVRQGPFNLELKLEGDRVSMAIRCTETRGHPLRVDVGAGETYHIISLDYAYDAGLDETCRGEEVSPSASSSRIYATMRGWLNECNKHAVCTGCKESWLPTRVIDVGSRSSPPKLSETSGRSGKYITLSHRWNELTAWSSTTLANFEDRKRGIEISGLSLTFQDAIEVTRELQIQYLWIDSLCIIQGSEEDWTREAFNMMAVYESAWLNIAAAGSEGHDGRLFMKRNLLLNRPCRLPKSLSPLLSFGENRSESQASYAYLESSYYAQSALSGFLDRRGWIMQERILSPRTVYYAQEEIIWECSEKVASEGIYWGFEKNCDPSSMKFNSVGGAPRPSTFEKLYQWDHPSFPELDWEEAISLRTHRFRIRSKNLSTFVEAYTAKSLTKSSDKLFAVAGLARALHKSRLPGKPFNESYHQGLWINDCLAYNLLWWPSPGPHHELPFAPSYSWASFSGPVKFVSQFSIVSLANLLAENISAFGSSARSVTRDFHMNIGNFSECQISRATWSPEDTRLHAKGSFRNAQLRVPVPLTYRLRFDQFELHFYPNESQMKCLLFLDKFRFQGSMLPNHAISQTINLDVICLRLFWDQENCRVDPAPCFSYEIGLVLIPHDISFNDNPRNQRINNSINLTATKGIFQRIGIYLCGFYNGKPNEFSEVGEFILV
jgi:hypothetical protein